jgi:hypothetical protein
MKTLSDLIGQYRNIAMEMAELQDQQDLLRRQIAAELRHARSDRVVTSTGMARMVPRFFLVPRKTELLATVGAEELLPFCRFNAGRVRQLLVSKYGRERVKELFDITSTWMLVVSAAPVDDDVAFTDMEQPGPPHQKTPARALPTPGHSPPAHT